MCSRCSLCDVRPTCVRRASDVRPTCVRRASDACLTYVCCDADKTANGRVDGATRDGRASQWLPRQVNASLQGRRLLLHQSVRYVQDTRNSILRRFAYRNISSIELLSDYKYKVKSACHKNIESMFLPLSYFFFRLFPSVVATADFPSPVVPIFSILFRHFNLSHVLFHHIHKPPFWPSPFPLSWQLHPQHPSHNMPIIFPKYIYHYLICIIKL